MLSTVFSYLLLFSLNFLIYCVAGRQFRTGLRQMLRLNSTPSLNEVRLWNGILNTPFSFMITMGLQLKWVRTKLLLDNMRAIVLWMFQFILFEVKTFTSKTFWISIVQTLWQIKPYANQTASRKIPFGERNRTKYFNTYGSFNHSHVTFITFNHES